MSGAAEHVARIREALEVPIYGTVDRGYFESLETIRGRAIDALAALAALAVRGEEGEPEVTPMGIPQQGQIESPGKEPARPCLSRVSLEVSRRDEGSASSGSPSSSEATAESELARRLDWLAEYNHEVLSDVEEVSRTITRARRDLAALVAERDALAGDLDNERYAAAEYRSYGQIVTAERDAALARAEEWERAAGAEAQLFNEAQRWAKDLRRQLEAAREALERGEANGETPAIRAWCSLTLSALAVAGVSPLPGEAE